MRKVGDLMKDLGFREGASDEVKIAFIKNLVRSAYGIEIASSKKELPKQEPKKPKVGEQLSFNLDSVDPVEGLFPKKKSS